MKKLLLAILLMGCGKDEFAKNEYSQVAYTDKPCTISNLFSREYDQFLREQVTKFSIDARKRKVPCFTMESALLVDGLITDNKNAVGYCDFSYGIFINRDFWMWASVQTRNTIVYHELGHCALGLEHHEGELDIMNPYIQADTVMYKEWNSLVSKLFNRARK